MTTGTPSSHNCSLIVLVWILAAVSGKEVPLRRCFTNDSRNASQPFMLPELILQWDAWPTSKMAGAIAGMILKEKMGFNVRLESGRTSKQQYHALSNGDIHLSFEAWPGSNQLEFDSFIRNDSVRAFNYSTLFGRAGIYETCSRSPSDNFATSRCEDETKIEPLLRDALNTAPGRNHFNQIASEFEPIEEWSPAHCRTQNCSVKIFHIAKTGYDEGLVEDLVQKLSIPATVAYLGEENHTEAIWSAHTQRAGALIYSYYPNTYQIGISMQALSRAKVHPQFDFKRQRLVKLAWAGLENHRGGDALAFVQAFDLDEEDYQELARLYDLFEDPGSAACTWLQQNSNKWQKFVKFPERQNAPLVCGLPLNPNANGLCNAKYVFGWVLVFIQLILAATFSYFAGHLTMPEFPHDARAKIDIAMSGEHTPAVHTDENHTGCCTCCYNLIVSHAGEYKSRVEFMRQLRDVPVILRHVRSFKNFARSNLDPDWILPPSYGPERWNPTLKRKTLFPYLIISEGNGMKPVLLRSLCLGLFSGSLATIFYQVVTWETYMNDPFAFDAGNPTGIVGSMNHVVVSTGNKFSSLITAFKFFPSFLALGYVGYAITRWREFQSLCYSIQGSLNNISLAVGSSLTDPQNEGSKRLAFTVYRYIQVIHMLVYRKRNRWLQLLKMEDFITLGLLKNEEVKTMETADNKMHEVVVSWLMRTLHEAQAKQLLPKELKLQDYGSIRGKVGDFMDQFTVGQPNLWSALMMLVCDLLIMMFVLGTAFESFLYHLGPFQVYVVVFSTFLALPWLCAQRLVHVLADPFSTNHDMLNPDPMIASTERTTFLNLRCGWHMINDNVVFENHMQKDTAPVSVSIVPATSILWDCEEDQMGSLVASGGLVTAGSDPFQIPGGIQNK